VTGAVFHPIGFDEERRRWQAGEYRLLLRGDFVLGANQITLPDGRDVFPAVDANHLSPGLLASGGNPLVGNLSARCPTGDWVEGGLFESRFRLRRG
jgi:hypothetical protein